MTTWIALLRGINVAGHKRVAMADLRRLLGELGYRDVRSLLQSGNLVFRADATAADRLERRLEAQAEQRLGLRTDFLVRTASEWTSVVAGNPFHAHAKRDPSRLVVMFLKKATGRGTIAALQAAVVGREVIRGTGRHAYIVYPDGMGRSRLTTALIEKTLGVTGTARNWNTVRKLAALVGA